MPIDSSWANYLLYISLEERRVAQWESASLTRKRSRVRYPPRLPFFFGVSIQEEVRKKETELLPALLNTHKF